MLKQFDNCTGPGGGTQRLHHKHTENVQSVSKSIKGRNLERQCVYDGAEIGSTGGLIGERSYPDLSTVIAKKLYNCKRKYSARNGISGLEIST